MRHIVFVYGTLTKGMGNHQLLKSAYFLGEGVIKGVLYDLPYGFPGVIEGNGVVRGEVYIVNDYTLSQLDKLEGYFKDSPQNSLYLRKIAEIKMDDGSIIEGYYYQFNDKIPASSVKVPNDMLWRDFIMEGGSINGR